MKRTFPAIEKQERQAAAARRQRSLNSATSEELQIISNMTARRDGSKKRRTTKPQKTVLGRERDDAVELNAALSSMEPEHRMYFDQKIESAFDYVQERRGRSTVYNREYADQLQRQSDPAYELRQNLLLKLYGVRPVEEARKLVAMRDHAPPPHPTSYLSLSQVSGMQSTENYERLSGLLFATGKEDPGASKAETPVNTPCHINSAVRFMEHMANTTLFEVSVMLRNVPEWVAESLREAGSPAEETMLVVLDFILDHEALYVVRFLYGAGFEREGGTPKTAKHLDALKQRIPESAEAFNLLVLSRPQFLALPYDTRKLLQETELTLLGYYYYVPKTECDDLYDTFQKESFFRDGILVPSGLQ